MRSLGEEFLSALGQGCLAQLTQMVRSDTTLCLELRGDYVNIYSRGSNLLEVRQSPHSADEYSILFDTNYFADAEEVDLPQSHDPKAGRSDPLGDLPQAQTSDRPVAFQRQSKLREGDSATRGLPHRYPTKEDDLLVPASAVRPNITPTSGNRVKWGSGKHLFSISCDLFMRAVWRSMWKASRIVS